MDRVEGASRLADMHAIAQRLLAAAYDLEAADGEPVAIILIGNVRDGEAANVSVGAFTSDLVQLAAIVQKASEALLDSRTMRQVAEDLRR